MTYRGTQAPTVSTSDDFFDQLLLAASSYGLEDGSSNAVAWMERFFYVEWYEGGPMRPIRLTPHQKRILLDITTPDERGRLPFTTIVFSTIKKSGKTTFAGAFGEWFAFNRAAPNEIFVLANDYEQSQGRIFTAIWKSIYANPATRPIVGDFPLPSKGKDTILLPNGTFIRALPSAYRGAAGSNHGLTLWSELWGFTSEDARRLWDELTPVPTRPDSIRFVETYAGFLGESTLLEEIYTRMVGSLERQHEKHEHLRWYQDGFEVDGEWYDMDLPVYVDRDAKTYVYWDHEPRFEWQSEDYYRAERAQLRGMAFVRLHKNLWVASVTAFLKLEEWVACEHDPTDPVWDKFAAKPIVLVADAGPKKDKTCLVATSYDPESELFGVRKHWLWHPEEEEDFEGVGMDFTRTLEQTIIAYCRDHNVVAFYYDPYQLHTTAQNLRNACRTGQHTIQEDGENLVIGDCPWMKRFDPIEDILEFPQGALRWKADSNLYGLVKQKRLLVPPDEELRRHATNAQAKEYEEGKTRLTKGKDTNKIDLIVAVSMGVWGAEEQHEKGPKWKEMEFLHL